MIGKIFTLSSIALATMLSSALPFDSSVLADREIMSPDIMIAQTSLSDEAITTAVDSAEGAVVSIIRTKKVMIADSPSLREVAIGTGFFVNSNGYIVTNNHVVFDDNAHYFVFLSNGVRKPAEVVYHNPKYDIAIIKINGDQYPFIPLGDSDVLRLGQAVISMGNYQLNNGSSVSMGVITGFNKDVAASDGIQTVEHLDDLLQTNADTQRGDSGSPVLDLKAEAVAVNVAMVEGDRPVTFAIPINIVKMAMTSIGI